MFVDSLDCHNGCSLLRGMKTLLTILFLSFATIAQGAAPNDFRLKVINSYTNSIGMIVVNGSVADFLQVAPGQTTEFRDIPWTAYYVQFRDNTSWFPTLYTFDPTTFDQSDGTYFEMTTYVEFGASPHGIRVKQYKSNWQNVSLGYQLGIALGIVLLLLAIVRKIANPSPEL